MSQSVCPISHSASSFVALPVALPVALRFEPVGYSDQCLCNVARQRVILDFRARREGSYLLTRLLVRDWRPPGHVNGHIPPLCARHYFGLNMDELRASLQALDECELPLEEEHYVRWGGLGRLDTGAARERRYGLLRAILLRTHTAWLSRSHSLTPSRYHPSPVSFDQAGVCHAGGVDTGSGAGPAQAGGSDVRV